MTTQIPLTQGYSAIVNDADSDLANLKWFAWTRAHLVYARRTECIDKKNVTQQLHRIIMGRILGRTLSKRELVDHADCDGLNNRRSNLRLVDHSKNRQNSRLHEVRNFTNPYKGVSFHKRQKKWNATITHNKIHYHLGSFNLPEEAHEAYKRKAKELFGEYARFE